MLSWSFQSFLRSVQRGTWLLQKDKNLKTWQRLTRPIMKKNENFPKGNRKEVQGIPLHVRGLIQPFSCFVLSIALKSKESVMVSVGNVAKKLRKMWSSTTADDSSFMKRRLLSWRQNTEKLLLHIELKESLISQKERS